LFNRKLLLVFISLGVNIFWDQGMWLGFKSWLKKSFTPCLAIYFKTLCHHQYTKLFSRDNLLANYLTHKISTPTCYTSRYFSDPQVTPFKFCKLFYHQKPCQLRNIYSIPNPLLKSSRPQL